MTQLQPSHESAVVAHVTVCEILLVLNAREQEIVTSYWLEGKTLVEVGRDMNVCQERIRQILLVVKRKLKRRAVYRWMKDK
jgi:RNA polymerase sigma factor (sigma-70 family)